MKKNDLLHLANLLNKFIFEYGEDLSSKSGYVEYDKINCDEVIDKIDKEIKNKRKEENVIHSKRK